MATPTSNSVQLLIGGKVQPGLFAGMDRLAGQLTGLNGLLQGVTKTLIGMNLAQRLASFTSAALEAADQMGKLAEKTGVGVDALAQLSHAARQDDVELSALQTVLKDLSKWMVKNGQDGRDLHQVLLEQADVFSRMPDGAQKTALALERFGQAGQDLLPFLNRGAAGIRAAMREAQRYGTVTANEAAHADRWGDALGNLTLATQSLARSLSGELLSSLSGAVNLLAQATAGTAAWIRETKSAQVVVTSAAGAVATFVGYLVALRVAANVLTALFGAGALRSLADLVAAFKLLPDVIKGSAFLRFLGWLGAFHTAVQAVLESVNAWRTSQEAIAQESEIFASAGEEIRDLQKLIDLREKEGQLNKEQAEHYRTLAGIIAKDIELKRYDAATTIGMVSELAKELHKLTVQPAASAAAQRRWQQFIQGRFVRPGQENIRTIRRGEFDEARRLLILRIEENRLITDRLDLEEDIGKRTALRLQQLEIERKLISELRQLTSQAAFEKGILSAEERRRTELEDKSALLRNEQQARFDRQQNLARSPVVQAGLQYQDAQAMPRMPMGTAAIANLQMEATRLLDTFTLVGDAISQVVGGAVHGISGAIEGLIMQTMTWRDAFLQVGQAILQSVVQAIAQMIARMIVGWVMQLIFGRAMEAQASAVAKAWAPGALNASIATYGTAAGVGLSAYLSALATGTAAGSGLAAFLEGGYTGDGPRNQPAGLVHRGEYVVPAPVVSRLGVDWFERVSAGLSPDTPGPGAERGTGRTLNQNIHLYVDRQAWVNSARDDIEAIALDVMRRHRWRTTHA